MGRGFQRGHRIPEDLGTTRPFGKTLGARVGVLEVLPAANKHILLDARPHAKPLT